jgi:SAM-dependent methyltransferase
LEESNEAAAGEFNYSGEELDSLGEARNYYGWITAGFAPWLGARMVEVGAGIGTFTAFLLEARTDGHVTAVEPAANNFPRLAKRWAGDARVTTVRGYLDDTFPVGSADAVVAVNVMEHVEDDAGFLRAAARALVPGGHVCLFVPALPALYGSLDRIFEHHRRYTRRGLEARFTEAGLEPVRVRYMNFPGMLAWWLWAKVLRRRTITSRDARTYDRWVVPLVRAVEDRISPPVGSGLLAVARKPATNGGAR